MSAQSSVAAAEVGVQPHGHLICCDLRDWRVVCVSDGLPAFFGDTKSAVLGVALFDLVSSTDFRCWMDALNMSAHDGASRRLHGQPFAVGPGHFDLSFRLGKNHALIEIEERRAPLLSASENGYLGGIAWRFQQQCERKSIIKIAADEIRILTGFDRCVVYDETQIDAVSPATDQSIQANGTCSSQSRWIADALAPARGLCGDVEAILPWWSSVALRSPDRVEQDWLAGMGARSMLSISLPASSAASATLVALNSLSSSLGGELRALVEQVGLLAGMRLHAIGG